MRGDGGPLKPKLAATDLQGLDVELREIEAGEHYELELTVTPPFESNRIHTVLNLETGVPEAPTVSIPMQASVPPRVVPRPREVRVPAKLESDWQETITLLWEDAASHKILNATVNDPKLNVAVEEKDGRQQVTVQVPEGYSLDAPMHFIIIETDDAEAPEVKVPITKARPRRLSHPNRSVTLPGAPHKRQPTKAKREVTSSSSTANRAPSTKKGQAPSGEREKIQSKAE